MATANYVTRDGDTLESICWKHYGRQDGGLVEYVLAFNQNLSFSGPILPYGLTVSLPDVPQAERNGTALWD